MEALEPLEDKYEVHWNNRIDRHPYAYPSYSELINHSVATSPSEYIILINDRCSPKADEAEKILNHLKEGYACSLLYNVGFMGFTKELVRQIGWWDQRFINGGWEDRDWVMRIAKANLALYESQEAEYSYDWKSPLQTNDRCALSRPHFDKKWAFTQNEIIQNLSEEEYPNWDASLGEARLDIRNSWKKWSDSTLGIGYDKPNSGPPGSAFIGQRKFTG